MFRTAKAQWISTRQKFCHRLWVDNGARREEGCRIGDGIEQLGEGTPQNLTNLRAGT